MPPFGHSQTRILNHNEQQSVQQLYDDYDTDDLSVFSTPGPNVGGFENVGDFNEDNLNVAVQVLNGDQATDAGLDLASTVKSAITEAYDYVEEKFTSVAYDQDYNKDATVKYSGHHMGHRPHHDDGSVSYIVIICVLAALVVLALGALAWYLYSKKDSGSPHKPAVFGKRFESSTAYPEHAKSAHDNKDNKDDIQTQIPTMTKK